MKYKTGLIIVLVLLLAACAPDASLLQTDGEAVLQQASDFLGSSDNDDTETEDVENGSNVEADPDAGQNASVEDVQDNEDVENGDESENVQPMFEMVDVPPVELGGDWFQPANPLEVDLSSGDYQLFDFSAFW